MKKRHIIIYLLIAAIGAEVYAQNVISRPRRVEICVTAGPTISWLSTQSETYKNDGICAGGMYGVNADVNIVPTLENYYVTLGLNARHKFAKLHYTDMYDYAGTGTAIESDIISKYNNIYLSIPTAVKLKTNPFGRFIIFGVIGLEHGFCLSAKSKDIVTPTTAGLEAKTFKHIDRNPQTFVFKESLYVVFGFEFIIQDHTKGTFGLAFDRGLNNLFKANYNDASGNKTANNNSLSDEPMKAFYNSFEFQFGFIF